MGSLAGTGRLAAFQNQIFPNGLDLGRCQIQKQPGMFVADPNTTFLQGMLVMLDATTEYVKVSDGTKVLGWAKWTKASTLYAVNVDEAIVIVAQGTAYNLKKGNVSNVKVSSAANGAGSDYAVTTDYTVNAANGQVTAVSMGGIAAGSTVYVTYTYALQSTDLDFQGRNFWNTTDEVSVADGRVTVITDADFLFTSQFDTTRTYAVGDTLYASTTAAKYGMVTNNSGDGTIKVGKVMQPPQATDPFLGIKPIVGVYGI